MKKLIALASAVLAATVLASAAEAGGGVRLGFGFPLGSFTATPSHGGGGSGGYSKAAKRKAPKAPVAHAARKPDKPAPRVAKAKVETPVAPKAVAEKVETTTEEAAPVTGSSALIQGSIPAEAPPADVKAEAEPATSEPAATASTEQAPDEQGNCKKFIPAIGTTVSVGCE